MNYPEGTKSVSLVLNFCTVRLCCALLCFNCFKMADHVQSERLKCKTINGGYLFITAHLSARYKDRSPVNTQELRIFQYLRAVFRNSKFFLHLNWLKAAEFFFLG